MACCGDVPTLETLAAVTLLRDYAPDLRVRVVNVVDLMALGTDQDHPLALADRDFDALFTSRAPVIFAFHGYPGIIHRLTYKRANHDQFHVHGFRERGTTTTRFDMVVRNHLDRFSLALDAIRRVPRLADLVVAATQRHASIMQRHRQWVCEHGDDMPEVKGWRWTPAPDRGHV